MRCAFSCESGETKRGHSGSDCRLDGHNKDSWPLPWQKSRTRSTITTTTTTALGRTSMCSFYHNKTLTKKVSRKSPPPRVKKSHHPQQTLKTISRKLPSSPPQIRIQQPPPNRNNSTTANTFTYITLLPITTPGKKQRQRIGVNQRQELEGTLRDADVSELEVVGRERAYVEACGAAVRRMAADALARGMKGLNQTDVGGALQVGDANRSTPVRSSLTAVWN